MKNIIQNKAVPALSGTAFLVMITPAWAQGFLGCGVFVLLLWVALWKLKLPRLRPSQGAVAAALVVCSGLGVNFYNTWAGSGVVARLGALVHLSGSAVAALAGTVLVLLSVPASACVLSWYWNAGKRAYGVTPCKKGTLSLPAAFCLLTGIYVLALLALIRANYYYLDDFGRALYGYKQWDYFSRYVSTGLSTFVHMSNYLADASPLPQLLAAGIAALAAVIMGWVVLDRTCFSIWEIIALIPVGLNPYFLECLSYRFDGPYMAVSMVFAALPLVFRKGNPWAYVLISGFGSLLVCAGYQSASGVFPVLVILLVLQMVLDGKPWNDVFGFTLRSVAGYGWGLVFFKLVIMKPADAGYVSNAMPGLKELLPNAAANLAGFYGAVLSDFKLLWLGLLAVLIFGFLWHLVSQSRLPKPAALGWCILALVLMLVLAFGIYPFLAEVPFAPRAMYGFGVVMALIALVAVGGKLPFRLSALVLGWAFFVFSFTYGDALAAQRDFTQSRVEQLYSDLNDLIQEPTAVQLAGTIGYCPVLENMPKDGAILYRLVPEPFGEGSEWASYGFYHYYTDLVFLPQQDLRNEPLSLIADKGFYTIYKAENGLLVQMK